MGVSLQWRVRYFFLCVRNSKHWHTPKKTNINHLNLNLLCVPKSFPLWWMWRGTTPFQQYLQSVELSKTILFKPTIIPRDVWVKITPAYQCLASVSNSLLTSSYQWAMIIRSRSIRYKCHQQWRRLDSSKVLNVIIFYVFLCWETHSASAHNHHRYSQSTEQWINLGIFILLTAKSVLVMLIALFIVTWFYRRPRNLPPGPTAWSLLATFQTLPWSEMSTRI